MNRVFFRLIPLPMAVKGVTIPDEEGDYTVIINENLCPESRKRALEHEISHIKQNHFSDMITVEEAEMNAG